jgi:hypothetical protein
MVCKDFKFNKLTIEVALQSHQIFNQCNGQTMIIIFDVYPKE